MHQFVLLLVNTELLYSVNVTINHIDTELLSSVVTYLLLSSSITSTQSYYLLLLHIYYNLLQSHRHRVSVVTYLLLSSSVMAEFNIHQRRR